MDHNRDLHLAGSLASITAEVLASPAGQSPAPVTLAYTPPPDALDDPPSRRPRALALRVRFTRYRRALAQAIIAVARAEFPRNQALADAAAAYLARHPA